ncbi:biotin--[acetyl-CoA-carboxylase] ligase [Notoacmeibacter ruber]|uniref:biotin--[acetyl-CoA-carboxylase] ligase n=1 Tax=Notoacmeibacter ruber TaxID=2670375 RepID=UPI001313EEA0|nr:biotin--[acetyl-CoA-carboxylase] ligase [Notoacmeibacter ruber]
MTEAGTSSTDELKADPLWPEGVGLVLLNEVDSTNAEARRQENLGLDGPFWVMARRQLAGRARRGRNWVSEAGNLYASLLLPMTSESSAIGTLPLVAALAVHRAIEQVLPHHEQRLRLKWPNDVLIGGAKVNGILLEAGGSMRQRSIIIGCGINCAHHPDNPAYPATDLLAEGVDITPAQLLPRLARQINDCLVLWSEGRNFETIRQLWLERAQGVGMPIRVNMETTTLTGRFAGLDSEGYLLLERSNGELSRISAGDLFFQTRYE